MTSPGFSAEASLYRSGQYYATAFLYSTDSAQGRTLAPALPIQFHEIWHGFPLRYYGPCLLGSTNCSGRCVNLQKDSDNCGRCGRKCSHPTGLCCHGACQQDTDSEGFPTLCCDIPTGSQPVPHNYTCCRTGQAPCPPGFPVCCGGACCKAGSGCRGSGDQGTCCDPDSDPDNSCIVPTDDDG